MDDKTYALINALAAKLGTTTEHLWSVLLKQAPISAAIDVAGLAFLFLLCVFWGRVYYALIKPGGEWNSTHSPARVVGGTLLAALVAIALMSMFALTGSIITAIFNPEFWALREVLSIIGR